MKEKKEKVSRFPLLCSLSAPVKKIWMRMSLNWNLKIQQIRSRLQFANTNSKVLRSFWICILRWTIDEPNELNNLRQVSPLLLLHDQKLFSYFTSQMFIDSSICDPPKTLLKRNIFRRPEGVTEKSRTVTSCCQLIVLLQW